MSKLSFFDKLGIMIEASKSSGLFIGVILVLIVLGVLLSTTNKKNQKIHKIIYSSVTIFVLGIVIVLFHESLGKMINYMMNNFFIAALFPNLAIYMAALIATNIILWVSIFSFKSSNQIKTLNIVVYIIMNYLFALILNVVKQDGLDIFSQSAVYENKEASALISLSSTIFIIWIIFLVIYKILLIYLRKDYKPKVKKVIIRRKVKKLPENFSPSEIPEYIYSKGSKNNTNLSNIKVFTKEEAITKQMESMFTLEDYKLLLKMLNEQKAKEKKISNEEVKEFKKNEKKPSIDKQTKEKEDIKESKIETKKTNNLKQQEEQAELKKYNELLELYKMH